MGAELAHHTKWRARKEGVGGIASKSRASPQLPSYKKTSPRQHASLPGPSWPGQQSVEPSSSSSATFSTQPGHRATGQSVLVLGSPQQPDTAEILSSAITGESRQLKLFTDISINLSELVNDLH